MAQVLEHLYSKDVGIKEQHVQEAVDLGRLEVKYVDRKGNVADTFTKARSKLSVFNRYLFLMFGSMYHSR